MCSRLNLQLGPEHALSQLYMYKTCNKGGQQKNKTKLYIIHQTPISHGKLRSLIKSPSFDFLSLMLRIPWYIHFSYDLKKLNLRWYTVIHIKLIKLILFCLFGFNVALKHLRSYHDGACL